MTVKRCTVASGRNEFKSKTLNRAHIFIQGTGLLMPYVKTSEFNRYRRTKSSPAKLGSYWSNNLNMDTRNGPKFGP